MTNVDVIIPVRNGATTIEYAIRSVLWQTLQNITVWVIDDGSIDNTAQVVKALANEDARIRLLCQQGLGISAALNAGIQAGSAPFIARMDADDISFPDRFERQIEALERDPQLAVVGSRFTYFGEARGVPPIPISTAECAAAVKIFSPFCHPATMMRRASLYELKDLYRGEFNHAEDYDLFSRLLARHKGRNLEDVLLAYRIHKGQVSQNRREEQSQIAYFISRNHNNTYRNQGLFRYLLTLCAAALRLQPALWRPSLRWIISMARQAVNAR